jgi:hypothetical protein
VVDTEQAPPTAVTAPREPTCYLDFTPVVESAPTAPCLNGTTDCDDDASAILFMPDMLFADIEPTTLECSTGTVVPTHSTGNCYDDDASDILFWPDLLFTNNCDPTLCHDNGEPSPTAVNSNAITASRSDAGDVDILFMPDLLFATDGENTPAAVPPVVTNTTSWRTISADDASDILFMPDLMFTAACGSPVCCDNGEASPPKAHLDVITVLMPQNPTKRNSTLAQSPNRCLLVAHALH